MDDGKEDLKLELRPATENDCDLLFQWANDDLVRQNSFSTKRITKEEHQSWFTNILHDSKMKQYIYLHNNIPVGQIRIEVGDEEALISYSIACEYRCMGYGKTMINALVHQVREDFPYVRKLKAEVKKDNIASKKVFCDNGFIEYTAFELNIH